jgi:hypothetical protein
MVMNTTMDFYGLIDLLWQPSPATTSAAHLEIMTSLINFNKPSINNIFPKLQQPLTASPCITVQTCFTNTGVRGKGRKISP